MIMRLIRGLMGPLEPLPGFPGVWILSGLGYNACAIGKNIIMGPHAAAAESHIFAAILAHEKAHIQLGHTRWWRAWRQKEEYEYEADALAAQWGHRRGLLDYLSHYSSMPDHPLNRERIRRLEVAVLEMAYGAV